ncbi:unnamed protein product [Cladocopium goreaui]|uniref:Retrovirus-related Pol polyprotein from type-1 retrotransposable element R2 n=1 Tax=Cladocopium goreaui TaxID=2562237 RepID=A0A9P1BZE3_9DINO|nr:unnamed protein product [Cladocopium goreaui]
MSDWGARLKRVQEAQLSEETEEIPDVSLEILKMETLTFGQTYVGRTYEELWNQHPSWIKWFYQHYKNSTKAAHKRVIMFIEKRIAEAELSGPVTSQSPVTPAPKSLAAPKVMPTQPKAKSMPRSSAEEEIEPELLMEPGNPWPATEDRLMMHGLQQRVLNMENAIHQILSHLTPANAAVPTVAPSVMSATELMNEWDDPWNP